MRILVIGGTGTVGSRVVKRLIEHGEDVRVLIRSEEKRKTLPAGATGVLGDLKNPASLDAAMAGVEKMFLLTPLSLTETEEGLNAVGAAKKAGVKHVVYMSVHNVEECPEAPHFRSKIEIQNAIEISGIAYTFIMPNNFQQNDYWFKQALLEYGVYPQPFGHVGLSRVDTDDIADAVVNALTQPGHEGKRYPLVGPEGLTADDTARIWARHLGKEIRYGGDDLDSWSQQARQMLPEWMVDDFKIMYDFFQRKGLKATQSDLASTRKILGRQPRSFDQFAAETAKVWKSETGK